MLRATAIAALVIALAAGAASATTARAASATPAAAAFDPAPEFGLVIRALRGVVLVVGRPGGRRTIAILADSILARRSFPEVRTAIVKLWTSPDLYDKALATTFCNGMYCLYVHPGRSTRESWHAYLRKGMTEWLVSRIFPMYGPIKARADAMVRTGEIANVSPRTAYLYWRACGGR